MNDMATQYPRTVRLQNQSFQFSLLKQEDRDDVLAFARALPEEDLRFLRVDKDGSEGRRQLGRKAPWPEPASPCSLISATASSATAA